MILALHGIWTKARDVSWTEKFEAFAGDCLDVRTRVYGWSSGLLSYFNWYRQYLVDCEAKYLNEVVAPVCPSIIAHSFGGYIVSQLLERGYCFDKIVLVAPAAPSDFDWARYESQFTEVKVYWSKDDEIIGVAAYGKMGKEGPKRYHPRVESVEVPGMKHSGYFPGYFSEWVRFFKQ